MCVLYTNSMASDPDFHAYTAQDFVHSVRPEDPQEKRLISQIMFTDLPAQPKTLSPDHIVILGYPDDRGVLYNFGRGGAELGPRSIREKLYAMAPIHIPGPLMFDLGDLAVSQSEPLTSAHFRASQVVSKLRPATVITLGGGHDWAWPDFRDITEQITQAHPTPSHPIALPWTLIHLDAHLDMRPNPQPGPNDSRAEHSGTGFRLLFESVHPDSIPSGQSGPSGRSGPESRSPQARCQLLAAGLQRHCNQPHHWQWAERIPEATLFDLEHAPSVDAFVAAIKGQSIALSICLDVFAESIAPGVSAPSTFGLELGWVRHLLSRVASRVRHLGIYELAPRLDRDGQTARLAATLIHDFLRYRTHPK